MDKISAEQVRSICRKYGADILSPEKCHDVYNRLKTEQKQLQYELDVSNTDTDWGRFINKCDEISVKSAKAIEETCDLLDKINCTLGGVDEVRRDAQQKFDKLNTLQVALQYLRVVQQIEFLSEQLDREYTKKDDERCATVFANLCEISRNLTDSPAHHLRHYLKETLHHWHNILKVKLGKDFDDILKSMKWPFVSANFSLAHAPTEASVRKLQMVAEYLLQIEIPAESSGPTVVASALLSEFPPLCLPVYFLVVPLRKRFLYHFYGNRQTNRADKPEWYFTQILTWIRDHRDFAGQWIQPVINKMGLHHIDAKLELTRGLVQLAVEKLHTDLPQLQYDDYTFSHTIDEALGFDKELRETYPYPGNQPSILSVLTQASIFVKWLAMEKKYAMEKMDAILASPDAFHSLLPASDIDEGLANDLKMPICADAFITLLQTITERYEALPQPGHRLQFLDLQIDLLDDFRMRLLQLVGVDITSAASGHLDLLESRLPLIANTIFYVENVLLDWATMLHFLGLYHYKSQLNPRSNNQNQVFDTNAGHADLAYPSLTQFDPTDSVLDKLDTLDDHLPRKPIVSTKIDIPPALTESLDTSLCPDNVFADTLALYRSFRLDLLSKLTDVVLTDVKIKSRQYRNERWSQMTVPTTDFKSLSLTPSACQIFEVLSRRLLQLNKLLHPKLFSAAWRAVAQQFDAFLFDYVVMDSRFSDGGALQFKFDVVRNLLPLFAQFTDRPATYFPLAVEAANLLTIAKGSALLLRETLLALEGATGVEDMRPKALQEVGVAHLTPHIAVKVLNRRSDITVNRMAFD